MKRNVALLLTAILITALAAGCSSTKYQDGVYTAEAAEFAGSGWKEIVEITIEGGKLTRVDWDAVYRDESIPIRKKQYSKSGLYGMMAAGSISEWYDQAKAVEQHVLENGIDSLNLDEGGYTDAISGCTIHMDEFERLVRECLARASK